jgi:hypothetical protein
MKWPAVSTRERRVVLAGAATVFALIAGTRGIPAWLAWKEERFESAVELVAKAARAQTHVRDLEATLDTLERRRSRFEALAPVLVGVGSPTAGAGALASLVSGAAQAAGVQLGSIQVRTDTASARTMKRVSIRANVVGDVRGITALLLAIEQGPALLAVRELSITQPDPAAPDDRPEALQMELVVEGLVFADSTRGIQ